MEKCKEIFLNEKYMNDAVSSIFSNINKKIQRQEEMSIWGTAKSVYGECSYRTQQDKMYDNLPSTNISMAKLKMQKIMIRKEIVNETSVLDEESSTSSVSNSISNEMYRANVSTDELKMQKKMDRKEIVNETSVLDKESCTSSVSNSISNGVQNQMHRTNVSMVKSKMQEIMYRKDIVNESVLDEESCTSFSVSNPILNGVYNRNSIGDKNIKVAKTDPMPLKISRNYKKRTMGESEMSPKNQACGPETNEYVGDNFKDWCIRRKKEYKSIKIKSSNVGHPTFNSSTCTNNQEMNTRKKLSSPKKEYSNMKSKYSSPIKYVQTKAQNEKSGNSYAAEYLTKNADVKKDASFHALKEKSRLCIKVTDKKDGKSFEVMSDLSDISRIKKLFPKLSEIIPDVDSGSNEINYCADTVNKIFRFVFNRSYNFDAISSPIIGIEVLAATQSWEIDKLHQIFQKDFLQKALTPSNISSVFSHAYHFGLSEICDACRNISPNDTDLNCLSYKRSQKTCIVTISTYVEPLEFCIPFHSLEKSFTMSFDKHISNKIIFKAISGCYIITGIQIQLNKDHFKENSIENYMLEIDYSIQNASDNQGIDNQREEKPLRPINIIYFKRSLFVNHNEIGEITVETDTKPYLCSASSEKIIVSNRKFNLTMESNFKVPASDKKLFIIGKLFYHVKNKNSNIK